MYRQRFEPSKRRLYVVFEGTLSVQDLTACIGEARQLLSVAAGAFDMITDISGAQPFSPEVAAILVESQATLVRLGLRRVVRVVGSKLSELQFRRTGHEAGFHALHVRSIAEAEALLDADHTVEG